MKGQIEIPSGTWTWHRSDVNELPGQDVDGVTIRLDLEGAEGSVMRVGPFDGEVDPGMIAIIALNPNEREIIMDGECWTFITLNRPDFALGVSGDLPPEPYSVSYHSSGGSSGRGQLPPGVLLGAATDDQLRGIIQRGSSD